MKPTNSESKNPGPRMSLSNWLLAMILYCLIVGTVWEAIWGRGTSLLGTGAAFVPAWIIVYAKDRKGGK